MSDEVKTKACTLPSFSGKRKDYAVFIPRFESYAAIKKFDRALEDSFVLPADPTALSADADVKKQEFLYE